MLCPPCSLLCKLSAEDCELLACDLEKLVKSHLSGILGVLHGYRGLLGQSGIEGVGGIGGLYRKFFGGRGLIFASSPPFRFSPSPLFRPCGRILLLFSASPLFSTPSGLIPSVFLFSAFLLPRCNGESQQGLDCLGKLGKRRLLSQEQGHRHQPVLSAVVAIVRSTPPRRI